MTEKPENWTPKRRGFAASILFAGLSVMLSACAAHSPAVVPVPADVATPQRIQLLEDSARLYERGVARGDPVVMALAAEMRADALGGWSAVAVESPLSPAVWLGRAKTIASGDAASGEIIRRIERRRLRGGVEGPFIRQAPISAGVTFEHKSAFEPGLPAVVYVESARPANFALRVEDPDDRVICRDNSVRPRKLCRWNVETRGSYSITVSSDDEETFDILVIVN